jgi:hypothetical protein
MVKNTDGTFSLFTPEQNYLSFKTKPYVYYSDSLKKIAFSFTELNKEGREEVYLWMNDIKYGPFQRINTRINGENLTVYKYDFIITTLSGKKIIVNESGIWGAFDKLEMKNQYGDAYGDCKIGNDWFIFDDQKLVGPIMNIPPDDPNDNDDENKYFWRNGRTIIVSVDKTYESGYYINEQLIKDRYYMLASNQKNYMMITMNKADVTTGYIINDKFTKSKDIFFYTLEEETKTLYWLILEGKNIVKYTLKL